MIKGKLIYSGTGSPARIYKSQSIEQSYDDIQFESMTLKKVDAGRCARIEGIDKYGYKFFAEYPSWSFVFENDEQDLNDCICEPEADNKYLHEIKPGIFIDVYDVLMAWNVTNPALQHLIKKALQAGGRGHKSREQDLQDIIDSAIRAKELEVK